MNFFTAGRRDASKGNDMDWKRTLSEKEKKEKKDRKRKKQKEGEKTSQGKVGKLSDKMRSQSDV